MVEDRSTTEMTPQTTPRRLTRSRADKVVGGVCGGLGRYFSVDPIVFRIAFVVLTIGGWGGGVLLYIIGMLTMPEDDGSEPAEFTRTGTGPLIIGGALVIVGAIALIDRFVPWFDRAMWPVAIIIAGVLIAYGGLRHDDGS